MVDASQCSEARYHRSKDLWMLWVAGERHEPVRLKPHDQLWDSATDPMVAPSRLRTLLEVTPILKTGRGRPIFIREVGGLEDEVRLKMQQTLGDIGMEEHYVWILTQKSQAPTL